MEDYLKKDWPVGQRVKDLMGRMGLEEKLAQVGSVYMKNLVEKETIDI